MSPEPGLMPRLNQWWNHCLGNLSKILFIDNHGSPWHWINNRCRDWRDKDQLKIIEEKGQRTSPGPIIARPSQTSTQGMLLLRCTWPFMYTNY